MHPLVEQLRQTTVITDIRTAGEGGKTPCSVFGVCENARAQMIASLYAGGALFVLTHQELQAGELAAQLSALLPETRIVHLPPRDWVSSADAASMELLCRRAAALYALRHEKNIIVIAGAQAMEYRLLSPELWENLCISIRVGDILEPDELTERLLSCGYKRVDQVEGAGQFARRGGLIDIFSAGWDDPVRIEFFDDEVDSVRSFDVISQRSDEMLEDCTVLPVSELYLTGDLRSRAKKRALKLIAEELEKEQEEERHDRLTHLSEQVEREHQDELLFAVSGAKKAHVTDYLPEGARVIVDEPSRVTGALETCMENFGLRMAEALEMGAVIPALSAVGGDTAQIFSGLAKHPVISLHAFERTGGRLRPKTVVRMQTRNVLAAQGRIVFLAEQMTLWCKEGYRVFFFCPSPEEMEGELTSRDVPVGTGAGYVELIAAPLLAGAEYPDERIAFVSAKESLSLDAPKKRRAAKVANAKKITDFSDLVPGDLVVHDQHGIARYDGIIQMEAAGVRRDYLKLSFAGTDIVYVPTDQMNRVQKYIGAEDSTPKLSKMGGVQWAKTRAKVQAGIRDMTEELAALYAKRSVQKGFMFSPDTPWQREFESEFPFEETRDQLISISEIKRDMEDSRPMDRLLLGDVGYGKTEVALRAAFKAVNDSKQVAILVPTTLLAQQHYETIRRRFEHFPVRVQVLSRFRTPQQQKRILEDLAQGQVDIIIGTHRLLAKDVHFADLGLLVIDEEQRFGVEHKEKIRKMRENVDVLTLSATPIPRTLNMSMTGIRDMSVIETPPTDRVPVQTYVVEYTDSLVRDAVTREMSRGGQTFIIYNKVQSIEGYAVRLRAMMPGLRVAVGHGQMPENRLEEIMQEFIDGVYDVLICTTIAENGIDIPNANTMIVCESDRFGLAQLYQLRGRVGRSRRTGYAYFTYQRDKMMTETAQKRLSAISEYTQFGSGFKIALRDLQIRGAGNLLGSQQHGHLSAVGYEMYCRMVQEAVNALTQGKPIEKPRPDPHMDMDVEALIPKEYISNQMLKIQAYQTIAAIDSEEAREDVTEELIDRYGDMPPCVERLIDVACLKYHAMNCGVLRVYQREDNAQIRFAGDAPIDPAALLSIVSSSHGRITLHQSGTPVLEIRCLLDVFGELTELFDKIVLKN